MPVPLVSYQMLFLNKKVWQPHWKVSKAGSNFNSRGREFHNQGATTETALSIAALCLSSMEVSSIELSGVYSQESVSSFAKHVPINS